MFGISIGKYEIVELKNREKEITYELEHLSCREGFSNEDVHHVFDFRVIKLQHELKVLRTKLKLMDNDDNGIA